MAMRTGLERLNPSQDKTFNPAGRNSTAPSTGASPVPDPYGIFQNQQDRLRFFGSDRDSSGRNLYANTIVSGDMEQFMRDRGVKSMTSNTRNARNQRNRAARDFDNLRRQYLRDSMQYQAEDFEKEKDNIASSQAGLLRRDIEQNLDQGLNQTRKNFSSRGLLYSGLRQGAEGQKRGAAASMYAQGRADINRELDDRALAMRQAAAQVNLQNYQQIQDNMARMESLRMENAIQRRQQAAALGRGLGYLGGAALGSADGGTQQQRLPQVGDRNYGQSVAMPFE